MFFRLKTSPSGQCLQLLEAFRNAQGLPRHRVVVSLGNALLPEADRSVVARAIEQRLYNQPELLPPDFTPSQRHWIDLILKRVDREGRWRPASSAPASQAAAGEVLDGVLIDQISHQHDTPLGPALAGWTAWNQLGLPAALETLGFNPAQRQAAAISVIHRLVDPGSERALGEWLPDSSLPELLGVEVTEGGKDRFYRISDRLLCHQAALEKHLRDRQGQLFQVDRTLLLYDLTNSYFEGEALLNPKAKRGNSKEKRHDCPQVVMGMIFDRQGCELAHKVFEGNQSDGKSLLPMIEELQRLIPPGELPATRTPPLIIMDGGVATAENLALLRDRHWSYLVNDSRRGRGRYRDEFLKEEGFETIPGRPGSPPVKVRWVVDPDPPQLKTKSKTKEASPPEARSPEPPGASPPPPEPDRLVLCKSEGRRLKEEAIRSRAETKYLAALKKLSQRIGQGKLKDPQKIQRVVGRLQQRHPRAQRFYQVDFQAGSPESQPASLAWTRRDADYQADDDLLGCYVLRTDRTSGSGPEWWDLYTTLTKAEDGFRALKSDLGLRPNYHQLEERVEGHVFITVLAYHLLWWISQMLEGVGDYRCWQTIKRILQTHTYATLRLPTKDGKLYRVRQSGEPEECQKAIYQNLKVDWKNLPRIKTMIKNENKIAAIL